MVSTIGPMRRPFRARCELRIGEHDISATTRDISPSGLGINVPQTEASSVVFKPGMLAQASFSLSDSPSALRVFCNVAWVSDKTTDIRGQPTVALGLRFAAPAPEVEAFVTGFKHTIVMITNSLNNVHLIREVAGEDYRFLPFMRSDEAFCVLSEQAVSALIIDTDQRDKNVIKIVRSTASSLPFAHFAILLLTDEMLPEQFETLIGTGHVLHYLCKPISNIDLRHTMRLAVEAYVMRNEIERLNAELERATARLTTENAELRRRVDKERPPELVRNGET